MSFNEYLFFYNFIKTLCLHIMDRAGFRNKLVHVCDSNIIHRDFFFDFFMGFFFSFFS